MVDKQRRDTHDDIQDDDVQDDEESAGWVVFAAMMLFLLGSFQALAGVVSLLEKSYYAVGSDDLVVHVGYQAWGWTHLVVGVVAASAAFGLMTGATWARVVGIFTAMASALVNIGFLAAAPVWAVLMITLDVLVIYAITAHGRDLAV